MPPAFARAATRRQVTHFSVQARRSILEYAEAVRGRYFRPSKKRKTEILPGAFPPYVNFGTSNDNTYLLAMGDVDGDGDLDIAVENYGQQNVVYLNTQTVPETKVECNSAEIVDGDTTPSVVDQTDFGSADINTGTVVWTFTIKNTGSGPLNLTGNPKVAVSGTNAADFSVTTQPTSPVGQPSAAPPSR